MLRPRLSPVLLIRNNGLVKTKNFIDDKYIGDPLNAVRIFNEKHVDELIILDIDSSAKGCEPNFKLISKIANECRMPLCYGGGIADLHTAEKIINLGVEKIAISSAAINDPNLIKSISDSVGSQSVAVVLDIKKSLLGSYDIFTHNGTKKIKKSLKNLITNFQHMGCGEFVINSIDRDGMMNGYDLNLAKKIRAISNLPITIIGGAGNLEDITDLISSCGIVGCGAGSLFVFKGAYRAVLINYPNFTDKMNSFNTTRS